MTKIIRAGEDASLGNVDTTQGEFRSQINALTDAFRQLGGDPVIAPGSTTVNDPLNAPFVLYVDSNIGKDTFVTGDYALADDGSYEQKMRRISLQRLECGYTINRPFRTLSRAVIEAGIITSRDFLSMTPAPCGDLVTIVLGSGVHTALNGDGGTVSAAWTDGYEPTDAELTEFNPSNGGLVLPRGCSVVSLDLRKTIVRPAFVPEPIDEGPDPTVTRRAIFKLTGGCYAYGFTIMDKVGFDKSHHLLDGFQFAGQTALDEFYANIRAAFSGVANINDLYAVPRLSEYRITGPQPENPVEAVDTTAGASPYVYNCSVRSEYGLCGMWANGAITTGFRSMVVAQYTGASLQRDLDNWQEYSGGDWGPFSNYNDLITTSPNNVRFAPGRRSYHIRTSNNAVIQEVSVFAIGQAIHHLAESGSQITITNSNSNFGGCASLAEGFQPAAAPTDTPWSIDSVRRALSPFVKTGNIKKIFLGTLVDTQANAATALKLTAPFDPKLLTDQGYSLEANNYVWVENPGGPDYRALLAAPPIDAVDLDTIDVQSEVQTDTGINPDDNDDNNTYTNIAGSRLYVRRLRDVRSVSERRYSILVSSATALRLPIRDYVIQPEGDGLTWTTRIQAVTAAETLKDVTNGINVELRYSKRPEDDTDFSATTYYRPADVVRKDNKHWFANVDSYGPWDEDNWTECYVHMEEAYAPEGYFINAQPIIIFNTDTDGNEDSTTLGNSFADDYTEAQLVSGVDYIAADQLLQNLGIDAAAATTLLIPQAEADRDADVSAQSWEVEFRRPTTIRLFGHAFEWAGYSNYSKALPQYQGDLSATNQFTYYFTNQDGGKVYGSGFNQDGLLVTPRGLTDVTTGEQLDLEAIGDSDRPIDLPEDPWTRAGTTLQPTNPGDDVNVTSAAGAVNIALEADGDSFFAGEMRQLGIVDIGGSLPGIGNIQLNVDGSGHFQGTVSVGNVVGASNTNTGVNVSDLGTVISQRKSTEGGSSVFAGKLGSETTSLVRANGSIILGPSTNPLFDVDALGDATTRLGVKGFLFNNVYHYEVNAFSGINGNLEAFSSIRLAQTGSDVSNDRGAFIAESNGSINAQINFDGSASFGGVIPASPNIELKANGTITIKDGNSFEAPTTSAGTNLFASGQAVFARNVTGAPIKIGLGVSDGTGPSNVTYLGIADAINADITGVKTKLFNDGSSQFAGDMEIGGTEASPNISLNSDGSSDFAGNMKVGDGAPTNGTGFRVDATGLLRCARTVTPVTGNPNCVSFFNAITNTKLAAFAGSNSLATTAQNPTYTSIIYNDGSAEFDGNITAGNVSFNLEADDETKYTATTDAEGNETRVYNGAVLDVKDRLTKADAALVALKSAAAAATDFASLQSAIATALANI